MCKAEETNALGMFNYSACNTCPLLNSDECPYKVIKADYEIGTWVRELGLIRLRPKTQHQNKPAQPKFLLVFSSKTN